MQGGQGPLTRLSGNWGMHIFDGIADLIRVVDDQNQVVYVNEAMWECLLGDEARLTCRLDCEKHSLCNPHITQRSLQTGEIIQREEDYAGEIYSVKTSPIWHEGQIVGAVEVFRNKTREKHLERELTEKTRSLSREMDQARVIQQHLLPQRGFYHQVRVDYLFRPQGAISGDMIDVFPLPGNRVGFYISDTVGHGFASGMTTMFIRQAMRSILEVERMIPSRTLEILHHRFLALGLDVDTYFTMFYGVYDPKTHKLYFSNAGHNCAPLRLSEGRIYPLEVSGKPICALFDEVHYEDYYVDLFTGDGLLLFTDGISESTSSEGEAYGLGRIYRQARELHSDLLMRIEEERHRHTQGIQKDDVTALLLEIF